MPRVSVKEQIVDAGLVALMKHGYNATGVADITNAAGVPKGSFYNHFKSKAAFAAAVVERYWDGREEHFAILHDAEVAPLERLRRYFASQVQMMAEWDYLRGCLLGNFTAEMADHNATIRGPIADSFAGWTRELEQVIHEAQVAGAIANRTAPGVLAAFTLAAWEGAVLRSRADHSRGPLDTFTQMTFEQILV